MIAPTIRLRLTTLRDKLIKIGAKIVHHARRGVFQLAEVAIIRTLFAPILLRKMVDDGRRPKSQSGKPELTSIGDWSKTK